MRRRLISNLLGLVGATIGGVLGFYTFAWLEDKGFYGLAIPGAFLGLGCGLLAQHHSIPRGILCGVGALGLSLFTEWKFHYFLVDKSFSFMVTHLTEKSSVTLHHDRHWLRSSPSGSGRMEVSVGCHKVAVPRRPKRRRIRSRSFERRPGSTDSFRRGGAYNS